METADSAKLLVPRPPGRAASQHPFEADPHDHAETPFVAYADVCPLLAYLSCALSIRPAQLGIYDPYYCEGSAVDNLSALGFETVSNQNVDAYSTWASGTLPRHEVLVTNPPFSGDHMARFFAYLTAKRLPARAPWMALMPEYVARKAYFREYLAACAAAGVPPPVFVGPRTMAYSFTAPRHAHGGAAPLAAAVTRPAAPDGESDAVLAGKFQCVWFVSLMQHQAGAVAHWEEHVAPKPETQALLVEGDPRTLPRLVIAAVPTPAERRWRRKQQRVAGSASTAVEAGAAGVAATELAASGGAGSGSGRRFSFRLPTAAIVEKGAGRRAAEKGKGKLRR